MTIRRSMNSNLKKLQSMISKYFKMVILGSRVYVYVSRTVIKSAVWGDLHNAAHLLQPCAFRKLLLLLQQTIDNSHKLMRKTETRFPPVNNRNQPQRNVIILLPFLKKIKKVLSVMSRERFVSFHFAHAPKHIAK